MLAHGLEASTRLRARPPDSRSNPTPNPTQDGEPSALRGGASTSTMSGHSQASGTSSKGVSMGVEYRVNAEEGTVVEVTELADKHTSLVSSSTSSSALSKGGSSYKPQLMHAFSSKTANAVRGAGLTRREWAARSINPMTPFDGMH